MPTCSVCRTQNPEGAVRCSKCGVAFGHQQRATADAKRGKIGNLVKIGIWVVILIVLGVVGPSIYHAGNGAYLEFHLKSVKTNVIKSCGGPIEESTPSYQKTDIEKCINTNAELTKAQTDFDNFTNSAKK